MNYDQAQAGVYATGAVVTVDSNGVRTTPLSVTDQLASPTTSVQQIAAGTATQLLPAASAKREVTLRNIGLVPVYVSSVDPGPPNAIVTQWPGTGNSPFTPTGGKLAPGEMIQLYSEQPVYVSTRPIGGSAFVAVTT